jgi:hypothetical protein
MPNNQTMREVLIMVYIKYRDDYLSPELWAEHNGLTAEQGKAIIDIAREVALYSHPDA